jgi:hypothetical protein
VSSTPTILSPISPRPWPSPENAVKGVVGRYPETPLSLRHPHDGVLNLLRDRQANAAVASGFADQRRVRRAVNAIRTGT